MMHPDSSHRLLAVGLTLSLTLVVAGCGGGGEQAAAPEAERPTADTPAVEGPKTEAKIKGTIHFEGEVPQAAAIKMDADPACLEKHEGPVYPNTVVVGEGKALANVFVRLTRGVPGHDYPVPTEPVEIDQQGCRYHPHLVGVMAGQPIKFLNSDGILHNVRLLAEHNPEENIAMLGTVREKVITLDEPEVMVEAACDVHPWMKAYIAVMPHPYFDVTGEDGTFTLDVPAGEYTVEAGHESLGIQRAEVTVTEGETATVDFTFEPLDG